MESIVLYLWIQVLCVLAQNSTNSTENVSYTSSGPSHVSTEDKMTLISSEFSFSVNVTVRVNMTSSRSSSLKDSIKEALTTTRTSGLSTLVVNATSATDPSALKTTLHMATAPISQRVTYILPSVTTNESQGVTSEHKGESVTSAMSSVTTNTTENVTSTFSSKSVTTIMTSKTLKIFTSKTITTQSSNNHTFIKPSFTSTYINSSQGATETPPRNSTISSFKRVTFSTGVTVALSATIFPINSTFFPSKRRTIPYNVTENQNRSFFVWKTSINNTVLKTPSVPHTSTSISPTSATPRATTKPTVKPEIVVLAQITRINEGRTLELRCKAKGNPPPKFTWTKKKSPDSALKNTALKNTARVSITSGNWESLLKILKTTREDEGTYVCQASNGVGKAAKKDAQVIIIYFHIAVVEPKEQPFTEGDTIQLECSAKSNARPTLNWTKDGKEGSVNIKQYKKEKRYVSYLIRKNITRSMGGNYTCFTHYEDSFFATSKMLYVQLPSKPTYPPPAKFVKTANTIKIPLYKISYLSTGKKISYMQVVVVQLKNKSLPTRKTSSYKPSELGPYSRNRTELYIAIVISVEDLNKRPTSGLILGDGSKTSIPNRARRRRNPRDDDERYYNAPLLPETYYTAFQRMVSEDKYYESLEWIPATKTIPSQVPTKATSNLGTILLLLLVFFVLLIAAIIITVVYVVKKQSSQDLEPDGAEMRSGKNAFGKMARTLSMHMARLHEHYHPSGPIPTENFPNHVARMHKSGDMHFSTEYEKVPEYDDIAASHSIDPANQWKNRYSNIVAYDYNRVKLVAFDDEPASDYINASYISGYNSDKTYIAAQGPLDETRGDFWRMVWEQNTKVIVMLTNIRERGRLKCSQYWPASGTTKFEAAYVSLEDVVEMTSYTIRIFRVSITGQKKTRIIKQFHFTSWPDHGVPKSATFLLAFVRQTIKANPPDAGPMVVHCSAGVGRTGTFIVIDSMLQQIAKEKTVDIFNYVIQLRKQRNMMVQTEQQYIFIHDALLDVILSGDTEIQASSLRNHVKGMTEQCKETGETKLAMEFQRLSCGLRPRYTFTAANILANKSKNRYANTLPYDDTRVSLTVQVAVSGSDYINANYVDAYMKKKAFIATQAPLPDTFDDFWRMIWEQKCYTIVALAQEVENTKVKINRYWPTTHPITFGVLQVEMLEEDKKEFQETRVFNITNTMDNSSQIVHQFHYTAWTSEDLSDSGINLLSMIDQIKQWQDASGNHLITVHCSAGVGRTGVFCAVSSLIERLKAEAVVDVFQTVKQLREQRPAMVQTKSQYEFCYRVLLEYLDTHLSLEEVDSIAHLPQSDSTGNPPLINEEEKGNSRHNSLESGKEKEKCYHADGALTSVNEKDSSNKPNTQIVTSERPSSRDVKSVNNVQLNVTRQDIKSENYKTANITLQNVTPEDITLKNVSSDDITHANDNIEDVTPKTEKREDVLPKIETLEDLTLNTKTFGDVTPQTETLQKVNEETIANHIVESSPPILHRTDSEESDPYVSPLSSHSNLNS